MNVLIIGSPRNLERNAKLKEAYCGKGAMFESECVSFCCADAEEIKNQIWDVAIIDAETIRTYYDNANALIKKLAWRFLVLGVAVRICGWND
jgi:hypothetical protein